jgi:hypothetical protein
VLSTLAAWAVLGFRGLLEYPHLLQLLSHELEGTGFSLAALSLSLGASLAVTGALPWLAGGTALSVIALRGRRPGADQWTFTVTIGACLALSPIIWMHYFALLFVPIAINAPRLAPIWALPLAFWIVGGQSIDPLTWQPAPPNATDITLAPRIGSAPIVVYGIAVAVAVLVLAARKRVPLAPAS